MKGELNTHILLYAYNGIWATRQIYTVNNIVFMNANRTYCLLTISCLTYDYLKEQKGLAAE